MIIKKEKYKPSEPSKSSEKSKNKMIKNIQEKISRLELTKEQNEFLFNNTALTECCCKFSLSIENET
jgi:hypothetical protein